MTKLEVMQCVIKSNEEKKQRNSTINETNKIKSNNFTKSNREKFNLAILILEKLATLQIKKKTIFIFN